VDLTDDITDPRLAKALAHPLRLEILRHLGDRTASPSEIAAEIGAPLTNVSYHVRKLRALGLIKLVRKTPKRGVIEHYYSAKPRRTVTDEAWGQTPSIVKEVLVGNAVEVMFKEMSEAASQGGFDRADMHQSAQRMKLDERGWKEVAALLKSTLDTMMALEKEAGERLEQDPGTKPVQATAMMTLFEAPPKPESRGNSAAATPRRSSRARSRV
jgi:DNA-binding transcriptional ArsR family regulator